VKIKEIIKEAIEEAVEIRGCKLNEDLNDEIILLESGLDSLGYAIVVTVLDEKLGYDPFVLMDVPVYPKTLSEFVSIYTKYENKGM